MLIVSLKHVFFFLLILPAIHSALASKRIRTLIYNTYAYVAESPKMLRADLPMENRPYGAPRSPLSPLAPSPTMTDRIVGYPVLEGKLLLWLVDAKLEQNWSQYKTVMDSNTIMLSIPLINYF